MLLALVGYLWHTRPIDIEELVHTDSVVSVVLRSLKAADGQAEVNDELLITDQDKIRALFSVLGEEKFNRKIFRPAIAGVSNAMDRIIFLTLYVSYQRTEADLAVICISFSADGGLLIEDIPYGIGRFGSTQTKRLFKELTLFGNQKP